MVELGRENLDRHGQVLDVFFYEPRWMPHRYGVHELRLVLLVSQMADSPPAVAEADGA